MIDKQKTCLICGYEGKFRGAEADCMNGHAHIRATNGKVVLLICPKCGNIIADTDELKLACEEYECNYPQNWCSKCELAK